MFFSFWLTSLCMTVSRSVHVATNFIPFYAWVIFHCIYVPHLLYPFLCWWTFRLLPWPGYCKPCFSEHWGACVFLNYGFLWNTILIVVRFWLIFRVLKKFILIIFKIFLLLILWRGEFTEVLTLPLKEVLPLPKHIYLVFFIQCQIITITNTCLS